MRFQVLLIGTLAAGCADDGVVERGIVEFGSDPAHIEAPAAASVGASFKLGVSTFGGGCTSYESTKISVEDGATIVEPYDKQVIPSGATVCTSELTSIAHDVDLRFDTSGMQTIRVRGRRYLSRTDDSVIEIPLSISIE